MQAFLEARAEIQLVVLQVVDCHHARFFGADLALQRATVGWVNPVADDRAVGLVDEKHPAVDVQNFVGADVILRKVGLVHLVGEGVEREETLAESLKLPVDVVGPALCIGTVVPVFAGLDVPEALAAVSVVVGLVVAHLYEGFLAVVVRVGDGWP